MRLGIAAQELLGQEEEILRPRAQRGQRHKDIRLTGPDTFEATTTYDLFDAAGAMTAKECIINETATRFE